MKTILIIEDEPYVREIIQDILELEGFRTLAASNGLVGVKLALEHRPDLVLCDVSMPEMDGYEVLNTLQQNPSTDAIPFIFLTARSKKTDLRYGMNLGADDYLEKPCTVPELLTAITSRLDRQAKVQDKVAEQLQTLRTNIAQFLPHELYTPLNGILGFSELLAREHQSIDRTEVQEIAEVIHSSALRLHHLMQNFLLYTQLELIRHNPEQLQQLQAQVAQKPESLIRATAMAVAEQFHRSQDLKFQNSVDSSQSIEIQISEAHLGKLVEEIVDNAFKFSEPQTPVAVAIEIQASSLLLSVTNQGRGMTAEQIANLGAYMQFERHFYEQQGAGLGLVIAQRLMELHQGEIQITSIPNERTVVQSQFRLHQ